MDNDSKERGEKDSEERNYPKFNSDSVKKALEKSKKFFSQKKVINIITISLLVLILILGTWIRLQNLPLLVDQTTGKNIPLALDPFYFLRVAETIVEQGGLPEVDVMRYPSAEVGFTKEILPWTIVLFYKMIGPLGNYSLEKIAVITPVIFFGLGVIAFMALVYFLTKSRLASVLSALSLSFMPPYLYRTMAGFVDHEGVGMFAFFITLLVYLLILNFFHKDSSSKKVVLKPVLQGTLLGLLSFITIISWNGISKFVFMIIPFSAAIFWLVKSREPDKKRLSMFLVFYVLFSMTAILFGWLYGFGLSSMADKVLFGAESMINGIVILFMAVDLLAISLRGKIKVAREKIPDKYRIFYSLIFTVIIGLIAISVLRGGASSIISTIIEGFLHPFGTGRVGLTVAENRQPYLEEWISQTGKIFFWLFFGGLILLGVEFSKNIKKNSHRFTLIGFWTLFVAGILFSRISQSSLLNGTNLISQIFYFGSMIAFFFYSFKVYIRGELKLSPLTMIIFSWAFFMLISARGALRLFFVITPFFAFSAGFFIAKIYDYQKKTKDDLLKMVLGILFIISLIGIILSVNGFYANTASQAKNTGPGASIQWQSAMSWVRGSTPQDSVFIHWWDYGHWVTYLGERRVVTDGGHAVGYWDHLIGRYLLTTPQSETALSLMKSHNVTHLLIDSSDLGKYGAYSSIGSDSTGTDRLSQIPTMFPDTQQTVKNNSSTTFVFQGVTALDEDIVYDNPDAQDIFLPKDKAFVIGVILNLDEGQPQQPAGVFSYNNRQVSIPIRYMYKSGDYIDFGEGIESTVYIVPKIAPDQTGIQIDNYGSLLYLSPKVSESLFAQLYLMGDPLNNYPTITLAHSESDSLVSQIKNFVVDAPEFFYYNGFIGPIKIWKVSYPQEIVAKEVFRRTSGEYAEFDDLEFTR